MKVCDCGSYAINPGQKGRDDTSDLESCDVCYWRKRADLKDKTIEQQAAELEKLAERYMKAASECVELEKENHALEIALASWTDRNRQKNAELAALREGLLALINVAERCDSWESFPSNALDAAYKVLEGLYKEIL